MYCKQNKFLSHLSVGDPTTSIGGHPISIFKRYTETMKRVTNILYPVTSLGPGRTQRRTIALEIVPRQTAMSVAVPVRV